MSKDVALGLVLAIPQVQNNVPALANKRKKPNKHPSLEDAEST